MVVPVPFPFSSVGTLGPLNIRALELLLVWEPMFDGSLYPKNLMQMFEYLPVLWNSCTTQPCKASHSFPAQCRLLQGPEKRFFRDEVLPELRHTRPGMLGMAAAREDANASQFYITLASNLEVPFGPCPCPLLPASEHSLMQCTWASHDQSSFLMWPAEKSAWCNFFWGKEVNPLEKKSPNRDSKQFCLSKF
jgi:cyclophilin family peptidyl-prolyl cis-trans isomerase